MICLSVSILVEWCRCGNEWNSCNVSLLLLVVLWYEWCLLWIVVVVVVLNDETVEELDKERCNFLFKCLWNDDNDVSFFNLFSSIPLIFFKPNDDNDDEDTDDVDGGIEGNNDNNNFKVYGSVDWDECFKF